MTAEQPPMPPPPSSMPAPPAQPLGAQARNRRDLSVLAWHLAVRVAVFAWRNPIVVGVAVGCLVAWVNPSS